MHKVSGVLCCHLTPTTRFTERSVVVKQLLRAMFSSELMIVKAARLDDVRPVDWPVHGGLSVGW